MIAGRAEDGLQRAFGLNPCVAAHELRMRMRGNRAFIQMFLCALLGTVAVLVPLGLATLAQRIRASSGSYYGPDSSLEGLGRETFMVLALVELSVILLVLPAYAAGAITIEREKKTLEMLRATLLSAADVVTGKLLVVLALGAVLLLTSLPLAAWCLFMGGVGPKEIFYVYAYLCLVAVWASALGVSQSVLRTHSISAVVSTYFLLILLCAVVPLCMVGAGGSSVVREIPGAVAVAVCLIAGAWLLVLWAFRWVWRKTVARRRPALATALAGLAVLGLLGGSYAWLGNMPYYAIGDAPIEVMMLLSPYVSLVAMTDAGAAQDLLTQTSALPGGLPRFQEYIWALAMVILLIMTWAFWVFTVYMFAGWH